MTSSIVFSTASAGVAPLPSMSYTIAGSWVKLIGWDFNGNY
jgi:hypothetical protein